DRGDGANPVAARVRRDGAGDTRRDSTSRQRSPPDHGVRDAQEHALRRRSRRRSRALRGPRLRSRRRSLSMGRQGHGRAGPHLPPDPGFLLPRPDAWVPRRQVAVIPIAWQDFEKVDIRVGLVTDAREFPEARRPAYRLWIDFGPLGIKRSSAQITRHYRPRELIGRYVVAVVNFPPKQIGPFVSEVLVLGAYDDAGEVILLQPDRAVFRGAKIG